VIRNRNELLNEIDMLRGNINRMCVTDNKQELDKMLRYAKLRLDEIYDYNHYRVKLLSDKIEK
jgi:hypothetical protein